MSWKKGKKKSCNFSEASKSQIFACGRRVQNFMSGIESGLNLRIDELEGCLQNIKPCQYSFKNCHRIHLFLKLWRDNKSSTEHLN